MDRYIRINKADNVAVAVHPLRSGDSIELDGLRLVLSEDIPAGHKFALKDLREGENVIKYGFPIGHLIADAKAGTLIDHSKLKTNLEGLLEYTYNPQTTDIQPDSTPATFMGYRRTDGNVGIRNQIWIVPTVGCVNGTAERLADLFRKEIEGHEGSVDAVVAYPHNYGCSQLGDDHENTRKILRDIVLHPNAGGVLVVGLGCENNQMDAFRKFVGPVDSKRIRFMETQKVDGDEIEYGLQLLREIHSACSGDKREKIPVSELRVGLKCGGSDGLSGITANPLLGLFSDWIVAQGGTTVLTEVPEMFGAETLLMNRCGDRSTFESMVGMINGFKEYFMKNGQPVYENPSPGNKAGGISTLEEKSLGCTQKSGSSTVRGILPYGERLSVKGLNLLSAPGNDLVASTALASAGCQIVLFTTGRGTPFGSFVPTVKISTNTPLAVRKPRWIDFNAGAAVEGTSWQDLLKDFIEFVLGVASGNAVNNEKSGFREIAIFKTGVTL